MMNTIEKLYSEMIEAAEKIEELNEFVEQGRAYIEIVTKVEELNELVEDYVGKYGEPA
ncbi:hypothetical protein [Sporosarcina beigongshangi]|uniref:hypothetical protein n=1 Tax=Sporosarcina beigongshangi TaxID=2782538 RepID=UPI00193AD613|nr:hypothetical protein [Sporosarcina beigongshangi]